VTYEKTELILTHSPRSLLIGFRVFINFSRLITIIAVYRVYHFYNVEIPMRGTYLVLVILFHLSKDQRFVLVYIKQTYV